nr:unnamed protein product [Digitaria exilis]
MQAATAPPPPPPAPRRRVYTAVDPRCEWASTEEADTLVVDVSGFSKEELRVVYNTRRKLKVTGERHVDGVQWTRFLKVFPVPRGCDTSTIQAKMNIESAQLFVIVPKGPSSQQSSDLAKDKHKDHKPERTQTLGELMKQGAGNGSSGSSSGSMRSAQEDPGSDKGRRGDHAVEEPRQDQVMAIQDLPRKDGGANENVAKNDDGGGKGGEDKRWWKKIRVVHVLGFVLVLALVGVGATILYIVLL